MLTSQLASRYAQAIYQLATEKQALDTVKEQLVMVEQTLGNNEELLNLLYHPQVPIEAKKETMLKVFGSEVNEYVRNFLLLLIDKRREMALSSIVKEYIILANEAKNIAEAEIITATPLAEGDQEALAKKLSGLVGKNIMLKPIIDQRILGGVIVKIGDKLIDGSVTRQLKSLQNTLLKTEVTKIGVTN